MLNAQGVAVRRFAVPKLPAIREILAGFFGGPRWVRVGEGDRHRTRYGSVYFEIVEGKTEYFVDAWILGALGVVLPYEGSVIGRLDKRGFRRILEDFEAFMREKAVPYSQGVAVRTKRSQGTYLVSVLLGAPIIAAAVYLLLRQCDHIRCCPGQLRLAPRRGRDSLRRRNVRRPLSTAMRL